MRARSSYPKGTLRWIAAAAVLTTLVALLGMSRPAEPSQRTAVATSEPAVSATTPAAACSAPSQRLPAPTPAPPHLTWLGDTMESTPGSPDAELEPVELPFEAFSRALERDFPGLTQEPPTSAHARDFAQYTRSMHARLQLTGDRSSLEVASLTLFDRIGAASATSEEHARVVSAFASVVLGSTSAGEVVDFIRDSCPTSGAAVRTVTHRWEAEDRALSLACHEHYGSVELVATGPGIP